MSLNFYYDLTDIVHWPNAYCLGLLCDTRPGQGSLGRARVTPASSASRPAMVTWEGGCEHGTGSDGPFLYAMAVQRPLVPTQRVLISGSCPPQPSGTCIGLLSSNK